MSACLSPRMVMAGQLLGQAPRGLVAGQLPLAFPNKFVNENLDYTVDFTFKAGVAATPGVTSLAGFTVTAAPVGVAGLTISQTVVNGLLAQFYLGGGVAGMQYMVTVTATLPNGKVMQAPIALQVLANPVPTNQPCTPPAPQCIDSADGDVITDGFGNPITSA